MRGNGLRRLKAQGLLIGVAGVLSLAFASSASADNYVVLYKQSALPASASADIQQAGGKLVYGYDQIGVAIARSDSASFADALGKDSRVEGVASTARFATKLHADSSAGDGASGPP